MFTQLPNTIFTRILTKTNYDLTEPAVISQPTTLGQNLES